MNAIRWLRACVANGDARVAAASSAATVIASDQLGTLPFRRREIALMAIFTALPFSGSFVLHGRYGAPLHVFSSEELRSMVTLHAFSVALLTAFIGYIATGLSEPEARAR